MKGDQVIDFLVRCAGAGQLSGQLLQMAQNFEHRENIRSGPLAYDAAPRRFHDHQSFGCEGAQSFAERGSGHAQFVDQRAFIDSTSRLQNAFDDQVADPADDLIVQRPVRDGDRRIHG